MLSHEPNLDPELGNSSGNYTPISEPICPYDANLDVLIYLIKGVRKYTYHPIKRYVSYAKLTQISFVASLDNTYIPRNIQETFQLPEWTKTVNEEIKVLSENRTWEITTLPKGKNVGINLNVYGEVQRFILLGNQTILGT